MKDGNHLSYPQPRRGSFRLPSHNIGWVSIITAALSMAAGHLAASIWLGWRLGHLAGSRMISQRAGILSGVILICLAVYEAVAK